MAKMSKRWLLITRSLTLLSLTAILAPLLISDVLEFQDYYGHLADILLPSPLWAHISLQRQQGIAGVEFIVFSRMKRVSFDTPEKIAPPQLKMWR